MQRKSRADNLAEGHTPVVKAKAVSEAAPWTFLTNHAHVLICLALDPETRIQDVAERVGITYRAVQRILDELEDAGYITRMRKKEDARSNQYRIHARLSLRHPVERHRTVAALLGLGLPDEGRSGRS